MDLSLVRKRVDKGYYRSRAALTFDVRAIGWNASTYNGPNSNIAQIADVLADALVAFIEGFFLSLCF